MKQLVLFFLFYLICFGALAENKNAPWANATGSGTLIDPWLIENASQLNALATSVNGTTSTTGNDYAGCYFALSTDIGTSSANSDVTVIGIDLINPFRGCVDGRGYNLYINVKTTAKNGYALAGLFGYLGKDAVLTNINIAGGKVTATATAATDRLFAGAIAAMVENGATVRNCVAAATVTCEGKSGSPAKMAYVGNNTDPAPVGNQTEWTKCGTYSNSGDYKVTYVTGESTTSTLSTLANDWVMTKLTGQAPVCWDKASVNVGYYNVDATLTLVSPVAFDPRQKINILSTGQLTLSATEDNSYALPLLSLFNTSKVTMANPKAIASVEKLKVQIPIPKKADGVLYANIAMPFTYDVSESQNIPGNFYTYNGKNRAENGTAGQTNWVKDEAGKNWMVLCDASVTNPEFISSSPAEALAAVRGVRYDAAGNEEKISLPYSYGVSGKSAEWKTAHFGWNVVNSGSLSKKEVTFTDTNISAIQNLTADGGYSTQTAINGKFKMVSYTTYFVQTTNEDTKTNAQTRAVMQPAAEAVMELLTQDGSVADRILATAGTTRPGRNVEKMGVGTRSLYIDKAGMKCAATDEAGRFAVRVTGSGLNMRLASVTDGVSVMWNGVPHCVGETFAAADGVLQLTGTPLANEQIDPTLRRAWGERGCIVIEGSANGTVYRIATAAGTTLASGRLTESRLVVVHSTFTPSGSRML